MTPPPPPAQKPETTLRGGGWTIVSRIYVQLIQFAIFIVAARLMLPEEFGLFALVAAFIVILNQLATAGWPEYILQCEGDTEKIRKSLLVALLSGLLATIIGVVLSLLSGLVTDAPLARLVGQVLALSILFASLGAAYSGALNQQNRLSSAALSVVAGETLNFAVAIWALYQGYGVLALAWGRLANSFTWCCAAAFATRLYPARQIERPQFLEMAHFSKHIIATRILVNLRIYAATFLIGGFVGAAAVGFFRAGQRIVAGFEEIVSEPTRVLAWNLFRKARDNNANTNSVAQTSQIFFRLQIYGAAPLFVGIAVLADDLTEGLLGSEWSSAAPVLQILALAGLIRMSGHATIPIISLAGRAEMLPRLMFVYSVISITCIAIGSRYGIVATAAAELCAASIAFVINAVVMSRHFSIHWVQILKRSWQVIPSTIIALVFPFIALHFGLLAELHPLARFFVLSLSILILYVPCLLILDTSLKRTIQAQLPS
ncbi:oligosaccharide flippase family protein [Rhodobacteraceae bacterium D3-12]|nr:oligosaccharide flippase family protein [Rhodobacteraceae bacterium D3-12]